MFYTCASTHIEVFLGHFQWGQPSCTFLQRSPRCDHSVLNQLNSVFNRTQTKSPAQFHIQYTMIIKMLLGETCQSTSSWAHYMEELSLNMLHVLIKKKQKTKHRKIAIFIILQMKKLRIRSVTCQRHITGIEWILDWKPDPRRSKSHVFTQ